MDNKIISCKWKHSEKAFLGSNNFVFLYINGLRIYNDRSEKDFAVLGNIYFEGMEIQANYPQKGQQIRNYDSAYWKKGDSVNNFFISGSKDDYFNTE